VQRAIIIRYTVVWDPDVESGFIELWTASDSQFRAVLTDIANWVDTNLSVDPDCKGQERSDLAARVLTIPMSAVRASVVYQVISEDRVVRVVRLTVRK
jgi:hypothetical protein